MKTIKVRIACGVSTSGNYIACGTSFESEDRIINSSFLKSIMSFQGSQIHWIEAEVPVPESTTIKGEVKNDQR